MAAENPNTQQPSAFYEEHWMIPVGHGHQLHMKRIVGSETGTPVLLLHGLVESGRIFYSDQGSKRQGLAYLLAAKGYDVFIADLRGKGRSWPAVQSLKDYGLHEAIIEDMAALVYSVRKKRKDQPMIGLTHSWGGVLLLSFLSRFPDKRDQFAGLVHFGCKKTTQLDNFSKRALFEWIWARGFNKISQWRGYFPATSLKVGSANEAKRYFEQCMQWMLHSDWLDPEDGFDYGAAAKRAHLPPSLYFASDQDQYYGNPDDVRDFMQNLGPHDGRMVTLGKHLGSRHNYGHVSMLMHHDADQDHFELLYQWLDEITQSTQQANN